MAGRKFLRLVWPKGIPPEHYPLVGPFTRMFEKIMRMTHNPWNKEGECPAKDIAGYALLLLDDWNKHIEAVSSNENVKPQTTVGCSVEQAFARTNTSRGQVPWFLSPKDRRESERRYQEAIRKYHELVSVG